MIDGVYQERTQGIVSDIIVLYFPCSLGYLAIACVFTPFQGDHMPTGHQTNIDGIDNAIISALDSGADPADIAAAVIRAVQQSESAAVLALDRPGNARITRRCHEFRSALARWLSPREAHA